MAWRRHLGLIIGSCIIILVIGISFIPRPILVDTALVKSGPFRVSIEEEGRTRVKDRYIVSAPVAGYLRRIEVHVGDPVEKDQEVAFLKPLPSTVLDPRSRAEAEARVAAAKAALSVAVENVNAAEAERQYVESEQQRLEKLYKDNNISLEALQASQAKFRKARANEQSAQFSVDIARFELEAAQAVLSYSAASNGSVPDMVPIKSPVRGRILKLIHESEGVVNAGEALLEIGNPLSLEIEVDVLSRDAVRISPGTKVEFKRWGKDEVLNGVVRTVEPVGFTKISALGVEEQRVLVINDITSPIELWDRLGDGYRVEAEFILRQDENTLQVPTSALFHFQDGWAVFMVADGRARLRKVKPGQRSGFTTEILSGLEEDTAVVIHPSDSVEDGSRVRVR